MLVNSPRFTITNQDWSKWFENQKTFLAPLGLIYVVFVIGNLTDGISTTDFVPTNVVVTAIALYLLNAVYDLLRKWAGENTYKV